MKIFERSAEKNFKVVQGLYEKCKRNSEVTWSIGLAKKIVSLAKDQQSTAMKNVKKK